MNETKSKWASLTVWGGIGTILAYLLNRFGFEVDDATLQQIIDLISQFGELVGVLIMIIGRIRATKRLA